MDHKVIGFCRYSVVTAESKAWQVGRNNERDEYVATVLDDRRLKNRLELFRKVTLPSIAGQSITLDSSWFKFCVFVSDSMPKSAYECLAEAVSSYSWCRIVPVGKERGALSGKVSDEVENFVNDEVFSSFRLDDDDALAKSYIEKLLNLCREEYIGYAVTFPSGCKAYYDYDKGLYSKAAEHWRPNTSQGLAYIANRHSKVRHVFELGNHARVDRRYPVISYPYGPMYIRTFHEGNDVLSAMDMEQRKNRVEDIFEKDATLELEKLRQYFALGSV